MGNSLDNGPMVIRRGDELLKVRQDDCLLLDDCRVEVYAIDRSNRTVDIRVEDLRDVSEPHDWRKAGDTVCVSGVADLAEVTVHFPRRAND